MPKAHAIYVFSLPAAPGINTLRFPSMRHGDSLDWKDYGVESIIKTVCEHRHLGNGSIILMHNGAKYTAEALPKVIEGLQAKGYTIVPVSQLIAEGEYTIDHEGRQHKKQ